jgi:hypothetical protein
MVALGTGLLIKPKAEVHTGAIMLTGPRKEDGNRYTPLPHPGSALPRPENLLVVSLFGSCEEFTSIKFVSRLVAIFCLGVYSGKGKGYMLAPCVTLVYCWYVSD